MRMKFIRILPDTWASTLWPFSSSTRNIALGSGSTTVPSTSIASSFGMLGGDSRENVGAVVGDGDRVLEVRGQASVGRDRRPAVLEHPNLPRPHGHHGLDGQHHAGLEGLSPPGLSEIRHLRLLVQRSAYPVPHEGAHHADAVALAVALHGLRDVADPVAHAALHDGLVEALAGDVQELLDPGRNGPDT